MKVVCFGFLNTKYPESPLRLISRVDLENYKGLKIMSLSYIAFCQGYWALWVIPFRVWSVRLGFAGERTSRTPSRDKQDSTRGFRSLGFRGLGSSTDSTRGF